MNRNSKCAVTNMKIKQCCANNPGARARYNNILKDLKNLDIESWNIDLKNTVISYIFHNIMCAERFNVGISVTPAHYLLDYFLKHFEISDQQVTHGHMLYGNDSAHTNTKAFYPEFTYLLTMGQFKLSSGVYNNGVCMICDISNLQYKNGMLTADILQNINKLYGFLTVKRVAEKNLRCTNRIHLNINITKKKYHSYPKPDQHDQLMDKDDNDALLTLRDALSKVKCDISPNEISMGDFLSELELKSAMRLNKTHLSKLLPTSTYLKIITDRGPKTTAEIKRLNTAVPATNVDPTIEILRFKDNNMNRYNSNLYSAICNLKKDKQATNVVMQSLSVEKPLFRTVVTLLLKSKFKYYYWKLNEKIITVCWNASKHNKISPPLCGKFNLLGVTDTDSESNDFLIVGTIDLSTISYEESTIKIDSTGVSLLYKYLDPKYISYEEISNVGEYINHKNFIISYEIM